MNGNALDYQGNFEVHLTVAGYGDAIVEALCRRFGWKFVHIKLSRGSHTDQPMVTWSRNNTVLSLVLEEANHHANVISDIGIHVFRVKIEADPNNCDVPCDDAEAARQPKQNYFEHHIKLRRRAGDDLSDLTTLCEQHAAHLSRNARRKTIDGTEERFVTARAYGVGRTTSIERLNQLTEALTSHGEQIIEVESEYTVYDSALRLDAGWLPDDK